MNNSYFQFTLNDIKKRIGHRNVFRVVIERLSLTEENTMFVAQRVDERKWTVKALPLSKISKRWDDVIDTAIDAVLTEGTVVTDFAVVKHIVPCNSEMLQEYTSVI